MQFIYLMFGITAAGAVFRNHYINNFNKTEKHNFFFPNEIIYILFFLFIFFLYYIFASNTPDYTTYIKNYKNFSNLDLNHFSYLINNGFLYLIIGKLMSKLDISFFYFNILLKLVFFVGFIFFIKNFFRLNCNFWLPLNFFCINFFSHQAITYINQFSAIGCFFLLLSLKKRNFKIDMILGLACFGFHKTGILILLLILIYHLTQIKIIISIIKLFKNFYSIFFLIFFSFLLIFFFKNDLIIFLNQYSYLNNSNKGFFFRVIIPFVFFIFFILRKRSYKKIVSPNIYRFTIIFFIVFALNILLSAFFSTVSDRLLLYFFPFLFIIMNYSLNLNNSDFITKNNSLLVVFFIITNLFFLNIWFFFSSFKGLYEDFFTLFLSL